MKVVFFDLETTGTLVNKHGIHQLSGEIIIDGEVKETFDFRVQPNPQALIEQEQQKSRFWHTLRWERCTNSSWICSPSM